MILKQKQFVSALRRAKGCKPVEAVTYQGEVNEYLFEHYLTPFLLGNPPSVGDLDFRQFTVEDVQEFRDYLDHANRLNVAVVAFYNVFSNAKPIARTNRAFC